MAENMITQYLNKILEAVYGKDVRQAIYDSIHQCYEDGKVGAVDLVAREQIANLVANDESSEGNSELIDIRVGADGKTYESAGEAVRGQISSMQSIVDQLKIESGILFDVSKVTEGKYCDITTGSFLSNTQRGVSDYIPITAGKTYKITTYKAENFIVSADTLCVFDNNKTFVTFVAYTIDKSSSPYKLTATYTADSNGYIIINYVLSYVNVTNVEIESNDTSSDSTDFNVKKWNGKKIIIDGDSVTALGYWSGWIKKWLNLSAVYNHAGSGMSLTWRRSGNDASGAGSGLKGYERVQQTYEADADAIIIMGDFNDASHSSNNLGAYSDTTTAEGHDSASWCARLNMMLDAIEEKYPLKPIVLIGNPPRPDKVGIDNWGHNQIELMKSIAQNRNYYFIDCYHTNIMRPQNSANIAEFTTNGDGVHLNKKGSQLMAQMIFEELKKVGIVQAD